MPARINYLENPADEEKQAILGPLVQSNLRAGPAPELQRFAFVLRDHDEKTVGGLWGRTAYDWATIELLYVPDSMQGTGVGRTLVEKAEEVARSRRCNGIWLDTFGFQAPRFYEKLGYEIFGELPDNPKGHSRYFLRKSLR